MREAAAARRSATARVTCRFTHVYPDGAAPYFTVLAPARRGSELEQWDEIKAAASEAILTAGGTITHHHAVGRDHRPWYDRQRPEPFAAALRAAKARARPRRDPQPRRAGRPGALSDRLGHELGPDAVAAACQLRERSSRSRRGGGAAPGRARSSRRAGRS